MGVTQTDLLAAVDENLKYTDTAVLSDTQKKVLMNRAVEGYSKCRPQHAADVKTATSGHVYDLPSDWEEGVSSLVEVEYPVDNYPPTYISDNSYDEEIHGADGRKLRFYANKPSEGETFWVRYTRSYAFDSNGDSEIPVKDLDGLSYLATAIMCTALANFYAAKANPTIPEAEAIEYSTRAEEFRSSAKDWYKKFKTVIKPDITGVHGSVSFIDENYWDRTNA